MRCFMIWHKWGQWEQYEHECLAIWKDQQIKRTTRRQRRKCEDCGKEQDEWLRDG